MNKKLTIEEFIAKAITKHGTLYDYSLVDYKANNIKVKIICKTHGVFEQIARNHLTGTGCPKCGKKLTTKEFIAKAIEKHGDLYDYSLVDYKTTKIKVKIICKTHGVFEQTANSHLHGQGCPKCTTTVSKLETIWLNYHNVPENQRNITIRTKSGKKYNVDGYDPKTNTIYEFNGNYWHGNPNLFDPNAINSMAKRTYGELYEKTLEKERVLRDNGYKVVSIWENDFKEEFKYYIADYKSKNGAKKVVDVDYKEIDPFNLLFEF